MDEEDKPMRRGRDGLRGWTGGINTESPIPKAKQDGYGWMGIAPEDGKKESEERRDVGCQMQGARISTPNSREVRKRATPALDEEGCGEQLAVVELEACERERLGTGERGRGFGGGRRVGAGMTRETGGEENGEAKEDEAKGDSGVGRARGACTAGGGGCGTSVRERAPTRMERHPGAGTRLLILEVERGSMLLAQGRVVIAEHSYNLSWLPRLSDFASFRLWPNLSFWAYTTVRLKLPEISLSKRPELRPS
ncbi:hypothetical protein B0H14DRAFT_2636116 [Mycena olivaceomarginata]|nr:hypothetical protein B0H14DRAFT_2636116 [Mycena olivaceomarginata]